MRGGTLQRLRAWSFSVLLRPALSAPQRCRQQHCTVAAVAVQQSAGQVADVLIAKPAAAKETSPSSDDDTSLSPLSSWDQDLVSDEGEAQQPGTGGTQSYKLRDYQAAANHSLLQGIQEGYTGQLIAMPTGSGKTFTFSVFAHLLNVKTLFLVHRVELVQQTVKTLRRVLGSEADVGVLDARSKEWHKKFVVTTVQAAQTAKTLNALEHQDFRLCVVDEAHHAAANTWLKCLYHLGFITEEVVAKVTKKKAKKPSSADTDSGSGSESGSDSAEALTAVSMSATSDPESTDAGTAQGSDSPEIIVNFEDTTYHLPANVKLLLGVTATPYRKDDRVALAHIFSREAYRVQLADQIRQGHLSEVRAHRVLTYTDISKVRTSTSKKDGEKDLMIKELSQIVNTPERNKLIVESFKELARLPSANSSSSSSVASGDSEDTGSAAPASGVDVDSEQLVSSSDQVLSSEAEENVQYRLALAFCCDIQHGEDLAAMFREHGVAAECIHSKHSRAERQDLLRRHQLGLITVLTNVAILTEGYDSPEVSCILMTRPTKSTGLYTQSVGRGLRPFPGKADCLVIDFTDKYHRLDKESDLLALDMMFEECDGVHLEGYEIEQPKPKPGPPSVSLAMVGGVFELYRTIAPSYDWVLMNRSLWLYVSNWKDQPKASSKFRSPFARSTPVREEQGVWLCIDEATPPTFKRPATYRLRILNSKFLQPENSAMWQSLPLTGTKSDVQSHYKQTLQRQLAERAKARQDSQGGSGQEISQLATLGLPPESVVKEAEKQVAFLASINKYGLTSRMLSKNVEGEQWFADSATYKQISYIRVLAEEGHLGGYVPDQMTKGEASRLISLGRLYKSYRKANTVKESEASDDKTSSPTSRRASIG